MKKINIKLGGLFRTIFTTSILCVLVSVLVVSLISILSFSRSLSATARKNLQQLSIEKSNEVDSIIQNQIAITRNVSLSSYVVEALQKGNDPSRLIEYLGTVGKNANGLYENFFITKMEMGFADCLNGATLHPVNGEPWYEECVKKGEFLGNNISPVTGRPVYVISYGVYSNGKFIGGLNNSIDLATMTKNITGSIKDGATKVLIIDEEGNVIASENSDQILQVNFNRENDSTKKLMKQMLSSSSGLIEFNFDGKRNIGSFAKMGTMFTLVYMPNNVYKKTIFASISKMIAGVIVCLILAQVVIFFISISISKPISVVNTSINEIATGNADLTKRLNIKAKHEVGSLVAGFNNFSQKMQDIIKEIKASQEELAESGKVLQTSTIETGSSITEILANIESVNRRISTQSKIVNDTVDALSDITSNLVMLENKIGDQSSTIDSASMQVEEMLTNIEDVNSLVNNMANDYEILKHDVEIGTTKQSYVTQLIQTIEEQSKMLQDANIVIASIASQTNLLAMNAAIESAHAGEAGKGFSVVADEIRKLSENSTRQSKTISEQLSQIINSISEVVKASVESQTSFSEIYEKIGQTDQVVKQINTSMHKQHAGSQAVSNALKNMNESTKSVLVSSTEISSNSKSILSDLNQLKDSSIEMNDSIAEMTIGAQKINQTGEHLSEITQEVKDSINKCTSQVEKFIV